MSFRDKTKHELLTEARDLSAALGPTVVRHDADLSDVTFMKRGDLGNDGTLAELPLDFMPPEGMSADNPEDHPEYVPTIVYRRDLREFMDCPVGLLRELIADPRIGDDWEVGPSPIGNLVLCRFDTGPLEDRWYAGYIDLAAGTVELWDGDPVKLPALAKNYPFRGPFVRVSEMSHEATISSVRLGSSRSGDT